MLVASQVGILLLSLLEIVHVELSHKGTEILLLEMEGQDLSEQPVLVLDHYLEPVRAPAYDVLTGLALQDVMQGAQEVRDLC